MAQSPATYTRSQLRDVLVEFYQRVDPTRLDNGVDINGMCDWILNCGPNDINAKMQAKYGQQLDFSILNSSTTTPVSAMNRISLARVNPLVNEQKQQLREQLIAFYTANDAAKLASVDKFIAWIESHTLDQFNALLDKKYGKSLAEPTPAVPTTLPALPEEAAPPVIGHKIQTLMGAPIRPLPKPPTKPVPPLPDLVQSLKQFYLFHGEANPDPVGIAKWTETVGMNQLNAKLMQIYGGNLLTLSDDVEKRAGAAPAAPIAPALVNKQRKRSPSEGCCDNYVLDLSGEGFGVCQCGFARSQHTTNKPKQEEEAEPEQEEEAEPEQEEQPEPTLPVTPSRTLLTAAASTKSLLTAAASTKSLLTAAASTKSLLTAAASTKPLLPPPPKLVLWEFDLNTHTLYQLAIAGYQAQNPSSVVTDHMKAEWASMIAPLTFNKKLEGDLFPVFVFASAVPEPSF